MDLEWRRAFSSFPLRSSLKKGVAVLAIRDSWQEFSLKRYNYIYSEGRVRRTHWRNIHSDRTASSSIPDVTPEIVVPNATEIHESVQKVTFRVPRSTPLKYVR